MELVKELLEEEIERDISSISECEVGSEQHMKAANITNQQIDRFIELKKVNLDEKKSTFEKVYKCVDLGVKSALAVGSIVTSVLTYRSSMRFEETGVLTTSAGKDAQKNLFSLSKFKFW